MTSGLSFPTMEIEIRIQFVICLDFDLLGVTAENLQQKYTGKLAPKPNYAEFREKVFEMKL